MKPFLHLLVLSLILIPLNAQAYIDPGAGSVLLQIILGGVAGLSMIIKLYWSNIKDFFSKKPAESSKTSDVQPDSSAQPDNVVSISKNKTEPNSEEASQKKSVNE